jgi:chemotaxis protein histidine kinase CheA/ActR/RegA family two-component response regulator
MNIDDLVALLRDEYDLGAPDARRAITEAMAQKQWNGDAQGNVFEFLTRTAEASTLVGMAGFGQFIATIDLVASRQGDAVDPEDMRWIDRAIELGAQYLSAPSDTSVVSALVDHVRRPTVGLDPEAVAEMEVALAARPELSAEEANSSAIAEVSDDDVVLKRDDADEGLLSVMLADAPFQLETMHGTLVAYAGGASDEAALAESQRIAHTLKGSGAIIGLPAIARVSHRLEDLLDWFVARQTEGESVPSDAIRDSISAVDTLQQLVGHLNGEEDAPQNVRDVLERLTEWAQLIAVGDADDFSPPPLSIGAGAAMAANSGGSSASAQRDMPVAPIAADASASGAQEEAYLRVGANHLNRVLRRATQSIVASQRFAQVLRNIEDRLNAAQNRQATLTARLRELQMTVERQVVDLNQQRDATGKFDPLEMDRYDSLHVLSRFVAEAVQDQAEMAQEAKLFSSGALATLRDEQRQLRDQHRDLLATRLVAVKTIVPRLRRNVAQTAAEMEKIVHLRIEGEQVTIDSDVLSRLTEPLLHLLRNAVDHGIESPNERESRGKPRDGSILLRFKLEDQYVRVECIDDGRGLNLAAIRDRAVRYGLIAPGAQLADDDLMQLILQRGFSTKDEISEISGRGVGMDIVNDRVQALKGMLTIESSALKGSTFSMRVPVSGGIVLGLLMTCGGQRVAVASDQVVSALAANQISADGQSVSFGEQSYPLQSLAKWLGYASGDAAPKAGAAILARGDQGLVALAIDAVLEVKELVVQDVGPLIRRISGMSVAALDDAGRPIFLVDLPSLQRRARNTVTVSASHLLRSRLATTRKRLMVVDDAISARRALQQVLEDRGYDVITASDGGDAIEKMRQTQVSLVLTDLEMPNVNGLELTRRIRDVPQWSSIPVIMVTSRTGDKYRDNAVNAGVDEYIVKPFTDAQVLATVKRLLDSVELASQ